MLSLFYFIACAGFLLASTSTSVEAGDNLAPHHFVPVWEAFPGRPNPIHQRFDPSSSRDFPSNAGAQPGALSNPIRAGEGPLQFHPHLFQPVPYPARMPELAHLYSDSSIPADWTEASRAYTSRYRYARIENRPLLYRPEPPLLDSIGGIIARDLHANGMALKTASPRGARYTEGVFLWPPLHRAGDNRLYMPLGVLEPRLSDIPNMRIRTNPDAPELFQLDVPVGGQVRRVLVARARPESFTTLQSTDHTSALWLFYESRIVHPHEVEQRKTLSFLGAMLLPSEAKSVLLATGSFRKYLPGADHEAAAGLLRLTQAGSRIH